MLHRKLLQLKCFEQEYGKEKNQAELKKYLKQNLQNLNIWSFQILAITGLPDQKKKKLNEKKIKLKLFLYLL